MDSVGVWIAPGRERYLSRRLTGVALSIALLVALAIPASAKAQEQGMEVELTPSRDSGVSGTAM